MKFTFYSKFKTNMPKLFVDPFFLFLLIFSFQNFAQINNNAFIFDETLDSNKNAKWKIAFQSLSYFHNREYFGKIADGYTLFGNQVSPKIIYNPSQKVSIEAGVFAQKDFGNTRFNSIQPIFTIILKKDSTQFRFGNLKGNLAHQLIEPLYNFEGIISNNLESGFQLTKKNKGNFFDLWVDWQRMIYQNSPFKEEIWGGMHWKPVIYDKNNFQFKTPIQFTAYHKGGQITIDNRPLKTETNIALGTEAIWKLSKNANRIILQNYVLGFKEQSNVIKELKSGLGFYSNITFENRKFNTMLTYYYGNSYSSKMGGDLYQSINKNDESSTEKIRNLLIFKLYKDFKIIENLYLTARFEPVFDIENDRFEHSEGLFISYKETFGLIKR
jgi:hypothetical protein